MHLTSVILILKSGVSYFKMNDYQKLCDENKNVTKTGVIIKGVYCVLYLTTAQRTQNLILLGVNHATDHWHRFKQ